MAIDSPVSVAVSVDEYHELLKNLTKDRELVKKLRKEAQEKDRVHELEVQRLQNRVRELENSAKWMLDKTRELEAALSGRGEVRDLKKQLQHAKKVIADFVAKERSESPFESDPETYQEIIRDARATVKGKSRIVPHGPSSSTGTSQSSQRTPRPQAANTVGPSRAQRSSSSSDHILSPMSITTARGTPLTRLSEASPSPLPVIAQDEYVEAQETQPWLDEESSSASSVGSPSYSGRPRPRGSRKSITTTSGSYIESIDWMFSPASISVSNGPYSLSDLRAKLELSTQKFQRLQTLETEEGVGMRLQIVRQQSQDEAIAFLYKPIWNEKCERGREFETAELHLIDWASQDQCEQVSDYLGRRGIGHQDSPTSAKKLHVFSFPSNEEEGKGWWYIGAMHWQQVSIPPKVLTLNSKELKKLAKHLSERSQFPYQRIRDMLNEEELEQFTIKMTPLSQEVAEDFCVSVLGVAEGSSLGSG